MRRFAALATTCRAARLLVHLLPREPGRRSHSTFGSHLGGTAPEGKEVDCIYGDWVLRNDKIVAVIGEAIRTRHANMSVINVGGSVVDLTERDKQSDQLSAVLSRRSTV